MKIIKSYQNLIESFDNDFDDIAILVFDKKNNHTNFHEGHEYMVEYGKSNFRDLVVVFSNSAGFTSYYYKNYKENKRYESNYAACLNWCEKHNIKWFWWHEDDYFKHMIPQNLSYHKTWVDDFWEVEELDSCIYSHKKDYHLINRIKARFILKNDYAPGWTYLSSWKDGYVKFFDSWYSRTFTNEKYVLIEPIKDNFGIFYSRNYKIYNSKQIYIINELENIAAKINRNNLSDIYKHLYRKFLGNGIELKNIDITSGKVLPENKTLISFTFKTKGISELYPVMRNNND